MVTSAVNALSGLSKGAAASSAARESARVALENAARQTQIADLQEQRQREISSADLANKRARLAASGIDPSQGSALIKQAQLEGEAEFDAALSRASGDERARQLTRGVSLQRAQGKQAFREGIFGIGTTLLRGLSRG
jgi:hypothetical protein